MSLVVRERGGGAFLRRHVLAVEHPVEVASGRDDDLRHRGRRALQLLPLLFRRKPHRYPIETWGICTRRAGKLYRARSRLYRSQILQVNPTSKYSFESSRRDLHNTRLCTDLRSFRLNIVKKVQYYWKAPRRAGPFCLFFLKSAKLLNCLA